MNQLYNSSLQAPSYSDTVLTSISPDQPRSYPYHYHNSLIFLPAPIEMTTSAYSLLCSLKSDILTYILQTLFLELSIHANYTPILTDGYDFAVL